MSPKEAIKGAIAIADGFGDKPPPQEVAQARANACLSGMNGQRCRFNHSGNWLIPMHVGQLLNKLRELKVKKNLKVEGEENLGVCEICSCFLNFKVHYSFETIYAHTSDFVFMKFPSWCWIKKEHEQYLKGQNEKHS